jgi:hypothetical protein
MALLQKAYLGATPLFRQQDWFEDGAFNIIDTSSVVTVTADNSAHTKGAYAEVIPSSSSDSSLLFVQVGSMSASATNTATLLDLATGASGSETVIAENIAVGGAAPPGAFAGSVFGFPYKLPSGTRISARIQSVVTGGKTGTVQCITIDAGDYAAAPTSVDIIGGNTANSEGISFSGANGTWVEAIASTSRAYRAVALVLSMHTDTASTFTSVYEVGVGAAGSEVSFGSLRHGFDAAERSTTVAPFNYLFGRNIPAGSRLAVKHGVNTNPDRYGFTLIGIP